MGAKSSKLCKFVGAQGVKRLVGGGGGGESVGRDSVLTPRGYFPIQVGVHDETTRRFVLHRAALGDADFVELLRKSAEEYGFCNEGVLRIPYEANAFEEWMVSRAKAKRKAFKVKSIL